MTGAKFSRGWMFMLIPTRGMHQSLAVTGTRHFFILLVENVALFTVCHLSNIITVHGATMSLTEAKPYQPDWVIRVNHQGWVN